MKRFLAIALAASLGLVMAGSASAGTYQKAVNAYAVGDAANGIGQSRHNLGGFGDHLTTTGTTEICIFCHTPHHTNQNMTPIWNRGIDAATPGFTAYGTTIAGSTGALLAPSLACLSCHDGVTTFDNLVNAPGKGTTNNAGGAGANPGASQGWAFFDGGAPIVPAGTNNMSLVGDWERLVIGDGGPAAMAPGKGLSNDHPIGVIYNGGTRASLRPTSTVISTIDLNGDLATSAQTTNSQGIDMSKNLWSVAGFISNTATIADLLRGPTGAKAVECSSCHDPHFNNKSWTEVKTTWASAPGAGDGTVDSNGLFLRRVQGNSGSGVCRTCHEK